MRMISSQPYATELLVQKAEASHADMVIAHYNRIEPPVSLPKTMRVPWWSVCWTPSWIRSTGCRLSAFVGRSPE